MNQTKNGRRFAPSRRRWGQNFLQERGVAESIIRFMRPEPEDHILEIGPGEGVLTGLLVSSGAAVAAVEIDQRLASTLKTGLASRVTNLHVAHGDALKLGPTDLLDLFAVDTGSGKRLRVIGNLPFNVSVHIIRHFLDLLIMVSDMTFMVQREVADRLLAQPGSRQYGFLSVMVQYACQVRKVLDVPRGCFRPRPHVDATVVSLCPWQSPPARVNDFQLFSRVVSRAFSSRRKTLFNNLRHDPVIGKDKIGLAAIFQELDLDQKCRGETLSVLQLVTLTDRLEKQIPDSRGHLTPNEEEQ